MQAFYTQSCQTDILRNKKIIRNLDMHATNHLGYEIMPI